MFGQTRVYTEDFSVVFDWWNTLRWGQMVNSCTEPILEVQRKKKLLNYDWFYPLNRVVDFYMKPKVTLALTKGDMLPEKWCFLYMNDFEATKWFLETLKIAGDSWDLPLQDPKMWSTFVDL